MALTHQADRAAPLPVSLPARAAASVMRGVREVGVRLWSSLWLIVAVAVIMASLVILAHLSLAFAIAAFVVSVRLRWRADG